MSVLRSIRFPERLLTELMAEAQRTQVSLNSLIVRRLTHAPVEEAATSPVRDFRPHPKPGQPAITPAEVAERFKAFRAGSKP